MYSREKSDYCRTGDSRLPTTCKKNRGLAPLKGLMGLLDGDMPEMPEKADIDGLNAKTNAEMRDTLVKTQMLGPDKTGAANGGYWRELAKVWRIAPIQARRRLCANCEYFDNTPEMLAEMESIPEDLFDADGGGRGYCHKFEFICHNLRVCKAWERKDYEEAE